MSGVNANDITVMCARLRQQGWKIRNHKGANDRAAGKVVSNGKGKVIIGMGGGHQLERTLSRLHRLGATGIADWPLSSRRATQRYATRPSPAAPSAPVAPVFRSPADPPEEDTMNMNRTSEITSTNDAIAELESLAKAGDTLRIGDILAMYPLVSQSALQQMFYKRVESGVWQRIQRGLFAYVGEGGVPAVSTLDSAAADPDTMPEVQDNDAVPEVQATQAPPRDPSPAPTTRHWFEQRRPPVRLPEEPSTPDTWQRLAGDLAKLRAADVREEWHLLARLADSDVPAELLDGPDGRAYALELILTPGLDLFARWLPTD